MAELQAKGKKARMMWITEEEYGVPKFAVTGGTFTVAQTILPGDTQIVFNADPSGTLTAGDIFWVYNSAKDNIEFFKVKSDYTSGATVTLDPATYPNLRHEVGETIQEIDVAGSPALKRVPGLVSTTFNPDIPLIESEELGGDVRGIRDTRPGFIGITGDIAMQLGIKGSGAFIKDAIGAKYSATGTTQSGGLNTTTNAAITAGQTTIPLTSLTNLQAGNIIKVDTGDNEELVKVSSTWNGTDNPVPLDASTPFRMAHADGVTAIEVDPTKPFVKKIKGGDLPVGKTIILQFVDTGHIAIYRGVRFGNMAANWQAQNGNLQITFSCVAKALQIADIFPFNEPTTISHTPFVPWEAIVKFNDVIFSRITQVGFTRDNELEQGAFVLGSRFIDGATEGDGRITGNFEYKFTNSARLKNVVFEDTVDVKFDLNHVAATAAGERVLIHFPRSKFGGAAFPAVQGKAPIRDTKTFNALVKVGSGFDTDIVIQIENDELHFE